MESAEIDISRLEITLNDEPERIRVQIVQATRLWLNEYTEAYGSQMVSFDKFTVYCTADEFINDEVYASIRLGRLNESASSKLMGIQLFIFNDIAFTTHYGKRF